MLIFPLRASNFQLDQEAAGMDCECCECTMYDLGMVYVLGVVGSLELLLTASTTITIIFVTAFNIIITTMVDGKNPA